MEGRGTLESAPWPSSSSMPRRFLDNSTMLVSESSIPSNLVASSPSWKMDLPSLPHVPLHPPAVGKLVLPVKTKKIRKNTKKKKEKSV